MTTKLEASFLAGILVKASFHPTVLKRAQYAILSCALTGVEFTADEALSAVVLDDPNDTTTAGCAVGSLASMKLIEQCGRCKSPSASRNGSKVSIWRIGTGKRETVKIWIQRNQFPLPEPVSHQLNLLEVG